MWSQTTWSELPVCQYICLTLHFWQHEDAMHLILSLIYLSIFEFLVHILSICYQTPSLCHRAVYCPKQFCYNCFNLCQLFRLICLLLIAEFLFITFVSLTSHSLFDIIHFLLFRFMLDISSSLSSFIEWCVVSMLLFFIFVSSITFSLLSCLRLLHLVIKLICLFVSSFIFFIFRLCLLNIINLCWPPLVFICIYFVIILIIFWYLIFIELINSFLLVFILFIGCDGIRHPLNFFQGDW